MGLSSDLVSQFIKATRDDKKESSETTVYGTTVNHNGTTYVKIDGSDLLTPISSTADTKPGERVTVMIKDHTATVTGNISSPAARTEDVKNNRDKIDEFDYVMAYSVTTEDLNATNATLENLKSKVAKFSEMSAVYAQIETLQAKFASLEKVSAKDVEALNADIENIQATFGDFTDISADELSAMNADITNLKGRTADFTYVSADRLTATIADVRKLNVEKLSATAADIKYATIEKLNAATADIEALETEKLSATDADLKYATIENLNAATADIEELNTSKLSASDAEITYAKVSSLEATNADVQELQTKKLDADQADLKFATIENLNAATADIEELETNKLSAADADLKYATIANLEAANAEIDDLEANKLSANAADLKYATIANLDAATADIEELNTKKLDAESAKILYANIDFSNIGKAAIEKFYATSGIIKDLVVGDTTITGELVGVTISGDLIKGNTIVAEKLVVKGEDGLYYKLNTDGITTEAEQTDYNSLNGSVIKAKSITATKISVDDLVAFDATIGGFNITDNAIYSGAKETVDNETSGVYLDKTGQMAVGDGSNYIKYFKDTDGKYKLAISAQSIRISTSNKTVEEIAEEAQAAADKVQTVVDAYESGELKGEDAIVLQIESTNGNIFKNASVATILTVSVIVAGEVITDSTSLIAKFGNTAHLQWYQKKKGEEEFSTIPLNDSRLNDSGFMFTIEAGDVDMKTVFQCDLIY